MKKRLVAAFRAVAGFMIILLTAQPAFAHMPTAPEYLSFGILHKDNPDDKEMDSDSERLGLDLNYGITALALALGFNSKYFKDQVSVGAFVTLFGVFVEGGAVQDLEISSTDAYLATGISVGYAEISARRIYDDAKTQEMMFGLKLPLAVEKGRLSIFKP